MSAIAPHESLIRYPIFLIMKKYEIEHVGIIVTEPVKMANWYRDVLGFNIKFSAQDHEKSVAFLTDSNDNVMLEFGKVPNVPPLVEKTDHHLQFHIALKSADPEKEAEYSVSMGATCIEKSPVTLPGDHLIVLRDPWGNTIQLAKRNAST